MSAFGPNKTEWWTPKRTAAFLEVGSLVFMALMLWATVVAIVEGTPAGIDIYAPMIVWAVFVTGSLVTRALARPEGDAS